MPTPEQLAHFLSIAPKTRIEVVGMDGPKTFEAVSITQDLQCAIIRELVRLERMEKGIAA